MFPLFLATVAWADSVRELSEELATGDAGVERILERGDAVVNDLADVALKADAVATRGWAVVCLQQIEGDRANAALWRIHRTSKTDMVRLWAASALVQRVDHYDDLEDMESKHGLTSRREKQLIGDRAVQLADQIDRPFVVQWLLGTPSAGIRGRLTDMVTDANAAVWVRTLHRTPAHRALVLRRLLKRSSIDLTEHILADLAFDPDATELPFQWLHLDLVQRNAQVDERLGELLVQWLLLASKKGWNAEAWDIVDYLELVAPLPTAESAPTEATLKDAHEFAIAWRDEDLLGIALRRGPFARRAATQLVDRRSCRRSPAAAMRRIDPDTPVVPPDTIRAALEIERSLCTKLHRAGDAAKIDVLLDKLSSAAQ